MGVRRDRGEGLRVQAPGEVTGAVHNATGAAALRGRGMRSSGAPSTTLPPHLTAEPHTLAEHAARQPAPLHEGVHVTAPRPYGRAFRRWLLVTIPCALLLFAAAADSEHSPLDVQPEVMLFILVPWVASIWLIRWLPTVGTVLVVLCAAAVLLWIQILDGIGA